EARGLAVETPMVVVVNRAPRARFRRGELYEEITTNLGTLEVVFLPYDARVSDASWNGETVGTGAFTRAVARVADVVATVPHRVLRSITELGPLSELLARRDVEEVFVEGARVTYLDTDGRLRGLAEPTTEEENRQILERLLAATERQLNAKHPMVQARVLDGTARLTAAIEPVADRLSATVPRYPVRDVTVDGHIGRHALAA